MKAYLENIAILVCGAFFATGCSLQEETAPDRSEMVTVCLNVVPEDADASRADSDASDTSPHVDRIICAAYDVLGNLLPELGDGANEHGQIVQAFDGKSTEIKLTLVKGQQYKFVLWAQSSECKAFDTQDLQEVKVDYSQIPTIDDEAEAFSKTEVFTAVANGNRRIVLRRALAKVNVLVEKEALGKISNTFGEITTSQVTVSGLPAVFSVVNDDVKPTTGAPESEAEFGKSDISIPGEDDNIVLVSTFLLAPNMGTKLPFRLRLGYGEDEEKTITLNEVIVQRNWLTNVVLSADAVDELLGNNRVLPANKRGINT